jgi:ribosomal protein L22
MRPEETPDDVTADEAAAPSDAPRPEEPEAVAEPEAGRGASAGDATSSEAADAVDETADVPAADEVAAETLPAEQALEPEAETDDEPEAEVADEPEAEAPAKPRRRRRRAAAEPAAEEADEKPAKPEKPAAPAPRRRRSTREPGEPAPVVRAQAKYVRSSARKARLVCDHIRGKSVEEARAILALTPRAIAEDWSKLLESAVANAEHNHELVGEDLYVKAVHADEGPTIKRFRPRAMGRATRIRKRTSHLTILLTPKN